MGWKFSESLVVFIAAIALVFLLGCTIPNPKEPGNANLANVPTFESCNAITAKFQEAGSHGGYYRDGVALPLMATQTKASAEDTAGAGASNQALRYSETNVQVQGVDEADIVKTDGKYIYVVTGKKLVIAEAYPAQDAKVVSSTELEIQPQEMFIEGNRVLLFGYKNFQAPYPEPLKAQGGMPAQKIVAPDYYPHYRYLSLLEVQNWNVEDKASPKLEKNAEFEGKYITSRKIGNIAYFAVSKYPDFYATRETDSNESVVPLYREGTKVTGESVDGFEPVAKCANIGYIPDVAPESFVTIAAIDISNPEAEISKETVVGTTGTVFASQKNLYIAGIAYRPPIITPLVDAVAKETGIIEQKEETVIHKFALDGLNVKYVGEMAAPGHVLNQFSMDEFEGDFRIATTIGQVWDSQNKATNNVYIFGEDLKMKGSLEDLAPGEKIYSARFMGAKAYLVTFKKVDPLFVLDLSDATNPKVLGKLKIPGYSDYLHPIDETHIIGIGKDAVDASEDLVAARNLDFAWYQGIKMAVFDVSDVENPREMFKVTIGDRGTDSYALNDHKAFLYDKEKNLLVIPVTLAEIKDKENASANTYGDTVYQGAYVYNLSLDNGFGLKGRITHVPEGDDSFLKSGYYWYGNGNEVKRSLFIGDVLYTVSDNTIKANALENLDEIKSIKINEAGGDGGPYYIQ